MSDQNLDDRSAMPIPIPGPDPIRMRISQYTTAVMTGIVMDRDVRTTVAYVAGADGKGPAPLLASMTMYFVTLELQKLPADEHQEFEFAALSALASIVGKIGPDKAMGTPERVAEGAVECAKAALASTRALLAQMALRDAQVQKEADAQRVRQAMANPAAFLPPSK